MRPCLLTIATRYAFGSDISDFVGKTTWWDSTIDVKDFSVLAQDPTYRFGLALSDSMLAEHQSNSATEAVFLYHTQKERHDLSNLNGFKN